MFIFLLTVPILSELTPFYDIESWKLVRNKKIEYIYNNENLGVAKALNIACQKAIKENYEFILLNFKGHGCGKIMEACD